MGAGRDDEEMGRAIGLSEHRDEKVGPYQFVWPDGEDYYNGIDLDDSTRTADLSTSKVGRKHYSALDNEEREPLIENDY